MRPHLPLFLLSTLAVGLLLAGPSLAAPLPSRIDSTRSAIDAGRSREAVLTDDLVAYDNRISSLRGEIRGLERRRGALRARLAAKRAELTRIRVRQEVVRRRLTWLRERLKVSEAALAARVVELYKADEPDALTVVLEADGFADLLERTDFLERVSDQDQRIVRRVRRLKAEAEDQAAELAVLEGRAQAAAKEIEARRDEVTAAKGRLARSRAGLVQARGGKAALLERVRVSVSRLEGNLGALTAQQASIRRRLARQASAEPAPAPGGGGDGPSAGPIKRGSGGLIYPVSGPLVSPFGMRWGRLHAGVDIAAPSGTPIRAAASGRVALMGPTGGYGNYTCVAHGGSLQTCYAHQSRFATSQGASVGQGDVIGYVGCTGHCFGDHLHFETRVNGSPVDPMGRL
jgi:murein DD-endopeptidase MepM/ murein hydrolase activator NlpD